MREDLRLMKACQAVFWLAAPHDALSVPGPEDAP